MTSSSERTILQQGQLDGFCLLYAVLNAFSAISPREITLKHHQTLWPRLIGVTPSLHNFASSGSSISDIPNQEVDVSIKTLVMHQYADILSHWLKTKWHKKTGYSRVNIEPVSQEGSENIRSWQEALLASPFPVDCAYIVCLQNDTPSVLKYGPTNDHWIAIVGNTGDELAVACSYTAHRRKNKYEENIVESGGQRRAYNNLITRRLPSTSIVSNSRYRISIC